MKDEIRKLRWALTIIAWGDMAELKFKLRNLGAR